MSFKVIPTPTFAKSLKALAKRHRSLKEEVKAFVAELERNPLQGVELTAGIRKIRMAIKSKGTGKSGGARVITYNVLVTEEEGEVYLLEIYDKSEYTSVHEGVLKQMIETLPILGEME